MDTIDTWAMETFGRASLGDGRRTARAVAIAASVARRPAGTITGVMKTSAEKEAAYRFVENERVDPQALVTAISETTALDCIDEEFVFVAVDQTDLTFMDRKGVRGLGPDGSGNAGCLRATQVMSALAMNHRGTPIGLMDLCYWLRPEEKCPTWKKDKRPKEERESWRWVETARAVRQSAALARPTRSWYIADRGADHREFFREMIEQDALMTTRACHDRTIERGGRRQKLFSTLRRQPPVNTVDIAIPRREGRPKRRVRCSVRTLRDIAIFLGNGEWFVVQALQLREVGRPPHGQAPLFWILLTTHPLDTVDDCNLVIRSYTYRWRVEEFHKAWKSGLCNIESSQLRSYAALKRWATISAAVATRAERLKRLSRETPDVNALSEFSQDELDAAILYMETKKWEPGDEMTLEQAVRLIALAGGYMGRKGDGPPGAITIRRGLERIIPAAAVLSAQRKRG